VQPLGGAPEVKLLGDRNEVLAKPEVELLHRPSLPMRGLLVFDFSPASMHASP